VLAALRIMTIRPAHRWATLCSAATLLLPALLAAAPRSLAIGAKPENFTLSSPVDGQAYPLLEQPLPKATVVIFIATQCPVSLTYDGRMAELGREYIPKGVRFLGINSNKQEPAEEVAAHARRVALPFPVVKDPNNVIADRWGALVTPEAFVLDAQGTVVYHGRIDDSQRIEKVQSRDLKAALNAVLAGTRPPKAETLAVGCVIKRVN
jgi:thiol-disulfide isomerase/thioredoxin